MTVRKVSKENQFAFLSASLFVEMHAWPKPIGKGLCLASIAPECLCMCLVRDTFAQLAVLYDCRHRRDYIAIVKDKGRIILPPLAIPNQMSVGYVWVGYEVYSIENI